MNILLSAYSCHLLIVMSVTLFDSHSLQNFGIRASALIFRRIMSGIGTTLLQSPGWNEGKARNATLGKHRPKRIELRRSGTYNSNIGALALIGCAAPWGLNKCVSLINPGLAPWAMQECRPCRAHLRSLLFWWVALKFLCWVYLILLVYLPWFWVSSYRRDYFRKRCFILL